MYFRVLSKEGGFTIPHMRSHVWKSCKFYLYRP
jgi:hypothetical protein